MYSIIYTSNNQIFSPEFNNIHSMVDFINQNPQHNYSIGLYNNIMVAYSIEDIIINGNPSKKFIKFMEKYIEHNYPN